MNRIRYCRRCNSIYQYTNGDNLCIPCLRKYDEIMDKIKEYLRENPSAGIVELSNAIEEKERDILYLLRVGRISLKVETNILKCIGCGVNIENGKYCNGCSSRLRNQLNRVASSLKSERDEEKQEESSPSSKMYTIDRHIEPGQ